MSAMKKTLWTRRAVLALFGCAATGLAGMRVSVVNGNRTVIPEKYYAEGEWLSMDGAFLGSKDVATDGYSFCIDGAELLTPREYLKRAHDDYSKYGIVDTKTKLKDADITCVIAVKMRVRNKDNVEGGIKTYVWHLVPESAPNYDFVVNTDLITQAMPVLGGSAAFAVQVGAENELLVPFMMQNTNDYFEGYETVRFEKAFPGTYTMKMTDLPERRLLRFEVK